MDKSGFESVGTDIKSKRKLSTKSTPKKKKTKKLSETEIDNIANINVLKNEIKLMYTKINSLMNIKKVKIFIYLIN